MSDSDFTVAVVRPCVKCGANERYKNGKCKSCVKARAVAWYAANADRAKASVATRYAANPSRAKAAASAWRAANPDKEKAQKAAWNAANADKVKTSRSARYEANADKVNAMSTAWRAANPETCKIYKQNRRALKKKAGGKLSSGLAAKLFKLQKGKCPCCKQPLGDDFHLDHIVPLVLGGANEDWNIQLLRQRYNNQKHAAHPVEFMQSRGFLL